MLLVFARAVNAPVLGQPPRELAIFLALAIGPMLFGHTGLNWALKYLPAYVVNLTLLGEPVGATFLAALLPGIREIPGVATVVGGLLVLLGIFVAARATRQERFAL
jgi:drug/metabolite transporter (DMT)-like permease